MTKRERQGQLDDLLLEAMFNYDLTDPRNAKIVMEYLKMNDIKTELVIASDNMSLQDRLTMIANKNKDNENLSVEALLEIA